jgi:hypothetical protein
MTASFKDTEGREWVLRVDVNSVRSIRDKYKIDLQKVWNSEDERRRLDDVCTMIDVVHELCTEQAAKRSLSQDDFGAAMGGDAIDAARLALQNAILAFYPKNSREIYQRLLDSEREVERQAINKVQGAIDDGLITKMIANEMDVLDANLAKLLEPTKSAAA